MTPTAWLGQLGRAWAAGARPVGPPDRDTIELGRRQRLGPILYDVASSAGWVEVAERLRPDFYRTLLVNQGLLAAADRATRALVEAGIDVVRLKGSELLHGVYTNPGLRPMDDVDLLVRPAAAEAAMATLAERGFRAPSGQLPLSFYRTHHFHAALVEEVSGAYLELHWQLMDGFRLEALDIAAAIAAAPAIDPARPHLGRRLEDDLGFLYLALHIDKHGPFHEVLLDRVGAEAALLHPSSEARLLWFVDLLRVLEARSVDLRSVAERAAELGVRRPAAVTLMMAAELLGRPDLATAVARPTAGWARRLVGRASGGLLTSRAAIVDRLIGRAMRMDPVIGVRPLRLLHLPLEVVAGEGGGLGRSLAVLGRGVHLAWDALRHRLAR